MALAAGMAVSVFNTSAPCLDERVTTRFRRFSYVVAAFVRFLWRKVPSSPVYLSASGGYAILYEATFVLTARMAKAPIVIHHHSFRYINERFWPMRLLRLCAGRKAVHIMLSESMARRFVDIYGDINYLCVSNCALLDPPVSGGSRSSENAPIIGFLSNLSEEKGLEDVVTLAEFARSEGMPWRFRIGGPFATQQLENRYRGRLDKLENVELLGQLLGYEKADFYASLDVFIMPTRYFNEAEPIVVLEAMRHGVPVIAYARGVIPEVLRGCGVVIPNDQAFVPSVFREMARWEADRCEHERSRDSTLQAYRSLFMSSRNELARLLALLGSDHLNSGGTLR